MANPDFLSTYAPLANDIATQTGVDPAVVLGIIDVETGGGKRVKGNNIFGISPGGKVASYPDVETASQAFVTLMQTPRYRGVVAASPEQQATALVKSGYNTVNPQYATLVGTSAASIGKQLGYQDSAPQRSTAQPAAQTAAKSEVDKALDSLAPSQEQAPAAAKPTEQSEVDKALASLPTPKPKEAEKPPQSTAEAIAGASDAPSIVSPEVVGRVVQAGKEGWEGAPSTQDLRENLLSKWAPGGLELGKMVVNPLVYGLGGIVGAGSAGLRALQQGVVEMTPNVSLPSLPPGWTIPLGGGRQLSGELTPGSLGRTLAAVPEAFPGDFNALRAPQPKSIPEAPPGPRFIGEYPDSGVALPGTPSLNRLSQAIQAADRTPEGALPTLAERTAARENLLNPAAVEAGRKGEGARPVGAQVTSGKTPAPTEAEELRNLDEMAAQTAISRTEKITKEGNTEPTMYDETPYVTDVPGGTLPPRIYAERDFDPQVALDHKTSYFEDPKYKAAVDSRQNARNEGMVDLLKKDAGDKVEYAKQEEFRDEVSPDNLKVFVGEKPVDTTLSTAFESKVNSLLTGPDQKRGAIRSIIKDVSNSLYDAKGNLEVTPSQWYGVRKNITDHLKKGKGVGEAADDVRAVKSILEDMLGDIDNVIQSGAPKFEQFRTEWHARSQRLDQMDFLQQYRPGGGKSIVDNSGNLTFNGINRLIRDIIKERNLPGVQKAKSLTEEQIQNIGNVQKELAAKDLAKRMADVPGSPTAQIVEAQAKRGQGALGKAVKFGSDMALHGIGAYAASKGIPGINPAISLYTNVGRPMREQRKLQNRLDAAAAEIAAMKSKLLSDRPVNPLNPSP